MQRAQTIDLARVIQNIFRFKSIVCFYTLKNGDFHVRSAARFVSVDKEELDKIVDEKDARSTKRVVGSSVNVLKEYCEAKETSLMEIENFAAAELNSFIRTFYAEVRRVNGELYA